MKKIYSFAVFCIAGMIGVQSSQGQQQEQEQPIARWNLKMKTLGGQQFWTDTRHFDGWRIQKNHATGHCRLIDPSNVRHAWGNKVHCEQKLNEIVRAQNLQPYSGKVVILLHGLNRAHDSMHPLATHLQQAGYQTLNFQYASGRAGIGEHALALQTLVEELGDQVEEINFVAHSMGNIVVRHYLHNIRDPETGDEGDERINRMVMIAPPNQGSRMARLLDESRIFNMVTGTCGIQLGDGWEQLEPKLATPKFQFAIIAGGVDTTLVDNPVLNGKNDLTISVEETRLPGAHDTIVRPYTHTFIMSQPETLQMTARFFQNGFLVSEAQRQPLESEQVK